MKRIICLVLCLVTMAGLFSLSAAAAPQTSPDIGVVANAALLVDLNSGDTLYELNADEVLYPASLTKIMTAILAIENGNLEDVVTTQPSALKNLDSDGTTVWLTEGEQMSLRNLLYCMLLASANDACNVVAEYISGSVDDFVDLMNQKAKELGCTNTHFANTNGLPNENHTTTARDLAIITQYAIQDPTFWEICTTTAYTVPATNSCDERQIATTNSMTTTYKYYNYYDSRVQGVKTGFTNAAGRCLIVTAQEGDNRLLSVVLGAPDTMIHNNMNWFGHYADTALMLDYGFDLLNGEKEAAGIPDAQSMTAPEPEEAAVPESPGDPAGEPSQEASELPNTLNANEGSQEAQPEPSDETQTPTDGLVNLDSPSTAENKSKARHFPWFLTILIILAILVEACIVYILLYRYQYRRRLLQRSTSQSIPDSIQTGTEEPAEEIR